MGLRVNEEDLTATSRPSRTNDIREAQINYYDLEK